MSQEVQQIKLELDLNTINLILKSLDEIPHKYAAPVIAKITNQVHPQVSPPPKTLVEENAEDRGSEVEEEKTL